MKTTEPVYEPISSPTATLIADKPLEAGHLLAFLVSDSEKRKQLLATCFDEPFDPISRY